jgi:hypothetical protein
VYSAILDRPDETILVDDLDSLQTDLQALHTSIQRYHIIAIPWWYVGSCVDGVYTECGGRRIQLLESELVILNDWQVKRDYNRK